MAENKVDFRLVLRDELSKEIKKTRKLTETSLKSMSKEYQNLTKKIYKEEDAIQKLEKTKLKASKKAKKEINDEIKGRKKIIAQLKKQTIQQKKLDNKGKPSFTDKISNGVADKLSGGKLSSGLSSVAAMGPAGLATGYYGAIVSLGLAYDGLVKKTDEVNTAIRSTFDVTGDRLDDLAVNIKTTADTFHVEYDDIIISANTLAKEMGISVEKANDLIETGFSKGANASGEFLDILKEYPAQLKSVGLNADESVALITQQVKTGVYSDKGIDAIKEAGLRLKENNKTTQDTLKLLDETTQKEVKDAIAKGDTFKAIQLISKKLKDTNLTAKQSQKIISNIFGGAGEDAGKRYLTSLSDINLNLNELKDTTSEYTKNQMELTRSWYEFIQIFAGDGILQDALMSVKDALRDALDLFNDVFNARTWEDRLKAIANVLIRVLLGPLNGIIEGLEMIGKVTGAEWLNDLSDHLQFTVHKKGDGKNSNGGIYDMLGINPFDTTTADNTTDDNTTDDNTTDNNKNNFYRKRQQLADQAKRNQKDLTRIETSKAVKSLTINIDAMVKDGINITTNNLTESASQIEKQFTRLLTQVVNQSSSQILK